MPGPRSLELAARLARVESPDTTCLHPDAPIFWERAQGANVWDVDGNRFVDLGGAFGVANVGHAHPRVVDAIARQAGTLLHGMGDVHPPARKVELLERLAALYPGGGPTRGLLCLSGSDAVESALKTALLATGRPGAIAFEGGYHGLGFGALDVTARPFFKQGLSARLPGLTRLARFGDADSVLAAAAECPEPVGCVIVEPVQGRGGERVPPPGFLSRLRELCDREGFLLIADEIYTGFGRTGRLFACEHEGVVPDLLCLGKGLTAGMPLSALMGRAEVFEAWPASEGEARQTWTHLGHPAGCAAALAALDVLEEDGLVARAADVGARALDGLRKRCAGKTSVAAVRGLGLMIGIVLGPDVDTAAACRRALARGVIALPSGDAGDVLSVTPPLSIDEPVLDAALDLLVDAIP